VRNNSLGIPLLWSVAIHICIILIGSVVLHSKILRRQDFLLIGLIDLPRAEAPSPKIEASPQIKPPPPKKLEQPKESPPIAKASILKQEPAPPLPAPAIKEEPAEALEAKPLPPAKAETPSSLASDSRMEGGGSEAGAANLFGRGDVGFVPGAETAVGGDGTAALGLGRSYGAPGLPAQTVLKTNREATPLQTVRANYPPMALRAGLESNVTLRIEVDGDGQVTQAEIIKSGGAGFDEEALKAVKQFRFEPAHRDGQNVPAEFTYIYRFRLQR
jgi:TonB family protein